MRLRESATDDKATRLKALTRLVRRYSDLQLRRFYVLGDLRGFTRTLGDWIDLPCRL